MKGQIHYSALTNFPETYHRFRLGVAAHSAISVFFSCRQYDRENRAQSRCWTYTLPFLKNLDLFDSVPFWSTIFRVDDHIILGIIMYVCLQYTALQFSPALPSLVGLSLKKTALKMVVKSPPHKMLNKSASWTYPNFHWTYTFFCTILN